jgi:transcriptional regulator with XRE-family HTH domain
LPTFGERFKKLRIMKGLTQEHLANDFNKKFHYNIGKSAISQYENDKRIPEISALVDFANYFEVSVDFLLCKDENKNIHIEEKAEVYDVTRKQKEKYELTNLPNDYMNFINGLDLITFDGKPASKKVINLIYNCLNIGIELYKKEMK